MLLTKMTKNTSMILIAAVAGIMIAGALAVAMPSAAFADQHSKGDKDQHKKGDTATAGNGGIGGAGGAGGVAGNGGSNKVEHAGGFTIKMLMAETPMAVMAEMQTAVTLATTNAAYSANQRTNLT